ncbi:MAG: hypothetical protein HYU66_24185 [Armatimonadetes bacterium]|nr:hypothetical protein [Armatimonadota bacterium]
MDFYVAHGRYGTLDGTAVWGAQGWWVVLDLHGRPLYGYQRLGAAPNGDLVLAVMWRDEGFDPLEKDEEHGKWVWSEAVLLLHAERRPFLIDRTWDAYHEQRAYGTRQRLMLDVRGVRVVQRAITPEKLPRVWLRGTGLWMGRTEYGQQTHQPIKPARIATLPRTGTLTTLRDLRFAGQPLHPEVVLHLAEGPYVESPAMVTGLDVGNWYEPSSSDLVPPVSDGPEVWRVALVPNYDSNAVYRALGRTGAGRHVVEVSWGCFGYEHYSAILLLRMVQEPCFGYGDRETRTRLYLDGACAFDGIGVLSAEPYSSKRHTVWYFTYNRYRERVKQSIDLTGF